MLTLVLALAAGADTKERQRTIEAHEEVVRQEEPAGIAISGTFVGDALAVQVVRERTCRESVVEKRTIERFEEDTTAIPLAVGLGGAGTVSLIVGVVAVAVAPGLPRLDDEFSRGELSVEGAIGIAALSGVLGAVSLASSVGMSVFARERIIGREHQEAVVRSTITPCSAIPQAGVTVFADLVGQSSLSATTDANGRLEFPMHGPFWIPEGGPPVVVVRVRSDAEARIPVPASAFFKQLRASSAERDFALFATAFPEARLPEDLESHRRRVLADAERARAESVARQTEQRQQEEAQAEQNARVRRSRAAELWRTLKVYTLEDIDAFIAAQGEEYVPSAVFTARERFIAQAEREAARRARLGDRVSETDSAVRFREGTTMWILIKMHPDTVADWAAKGLGKTPSDAAKKRAAYECVGLDDIDHKLIRFHVAVALDVSRAVVLSGTRADFKRVCAEVDQQKVDFLLARMASEKSIRDLPLPIPWSPPDLSLEPLADVLDRAFRAAPCLVVRPICINEMGEATKHLAAGGSEASTTVGQRMCLELFRHTSDPNEQDCLEVLRLFGKVRR